MARKRLHPIFSVVEKGFQDRREVALIGIKGRPDPVRKVESGRITGDKVQRLVGEHRMGSSEARRVWFLALAFGVLATGASALEVREPAVLPDTLAQWYKPQNQRQVWLHTMFAMRREVQAVERYAAGGDLERMRAWSRRLLEHYRRIPEMVPEWRDELDLERAERLQAAAENGDATAVLRSMQGLGRTCRSCHHEYRALAAARFRSPDFSDLSFDDGRGGRRSHAKQMETLSRATNGVKIALEDGLWADSLSSLEDLRGGLKQLGESCGRCHADAAPQERILGAASRATLDRLEAALREADVRNAEASLGETAVIICARCHGVHRTLYDLRESLFSRGGEGGSGL